MSIFAGAPDYSHIIWRMPSFPRDGSGDGIGGLVSGLTGGIAARSGFNDALGQWKDAKDFAEGQGFEFDEPRPSFGKSFLGVDKWQADQITGGNSGYPGGGAQRGGEGGQSPASGGLEPVYTGPATSYLQGVTDSSDMLINIQQDALRAMLA